MLGVRLDADTETRLNTLAKKMHRSKSYIAKEALLRFIEAEELREQETQLLEARWREYQESGEMVSQDTMDRWLDSWGDNKELPCPAN